MGRRRKRTEILWGVDEFLVVEESHNRPGKGCVNLGIMILISTRYCPDLTIEHASCALYHFNFHLVLILLVWFELGLIFAENLLLQVPALMP